MDVIQQIVRGSGEVLAKLLFRKQEGHEAVVEYTASAREAGILIWSLLAARDYNEAEGLLLRELDRNFDFDLYATGIEFFDALDRMSDEGLRERGYSREKIGEGEKRLFRVLKGKCGFNRD
ncbi:MAG: DUF6483 family protein [Clostridiales bacterium]|nr:DUF6483 family protein [Clostridiales bacterium]